MAKRRCPICGGNNTARILWGLPAWTPELEEKLNNKSIVLGGCCISGNDPSYYCNDCEANIIFPTDREEAETVFFEFGIGGFFDGYQKMEVEKKDDAFTAKYFPAFGSEDSAFEIRLTSDEFRTFIHKVYATSLLEWKEEYVDPYVLDGTQWEITIRYTDGKAQKWYGSNAYPPLWKRFIKAVNSLDLPEVK